MFRVCLFCTFVLVVHPILSQCPAPSFTAPPVVCINESFFIQNNSSGATRFDWDFCPVDLVQTPALSAIGSLGGLISVEDIKVVSDNNQWYGFALGRRNNTIARIEFGTSLSNPNPVIVYLGNPGNLLNFPTAVEIIKEGNTWLGVLLNTADDKLIRLNFGSSLTNNTPTPSIIYTSIGSPGASMTVIQPQGGRGVALVTEFNNNVTAVRFDQGFLQASTGATVVAITGNPLLIDLHAVESCGNWYVYVVGYGGAGKITRLDYLKDFTNTPAQTTFG